MKNWIYWMLAVDIILLGCLACCTNFSDSQINDKVNNENKRLAESTYITEVRTDMYGNVWVLLHDLVSNEVITKYLGNKAYNNIKIVVDCPKDKPMFLEVTGDYCIVHVHTPNEVKSVD